MYNKDVAEMEVRTNAGIGQNRERGAMDSPKLNQVVARMPSRITNTRASMPLLFLLDAPAVGAQREYDRVSATPPQRSCTGFFVPYPIHHGMRFRGSIKVMDEAAENIFDLSLMVDEILRPRLLMRPHSHPHGKPFGKLEDILVRFVIADEKHTGHV
jgi:hypothetical protein